MLPALAAWALTLAPGLQLLPHVEALPIDGSITTRAIYNDSNPQSSGGNNTVIILIVAVGLVTLIGFAFVVARKYQKRYGELVKPARSQQARNGSTRTSTAGRTPARRTTLNYTSIGDRTGNARVESRGANNPSATRPTRRPTQQSTRSLPVYNEQAPDDEVVLLERVRRRSMAENDEDDHSGDETENTPLTGAAPPYTPPPSTPGVPRVTLTTINSRGSTGSVESLHERSENPRSGAMTTASSNATVPERAGEPAVNTPRATENASPSTYGDVPTYEEATATTHRVAEATTEPESTTTPITRVEQR